MNAPMRPNGPAIRRGPGTIPIRIKAFIVVVAATFVVTATLFGISRIVLADGFAGIERESAERDANRVLNAISTDISQLDTTALDWASWDETYAFAAGANEPFAADNLSNETLQDLNLNVLLITSVQSTTLAAYAIDRATGATRPFPSALHDLVRFGLHDDRYGQAPTAASGILPVDGQLLMYAARPVLTSHDEGPARGLLLMGRFLDEAEMAHLSARTLLDIHVVRHEGIAAGLRPDVDQPITIDTSASEFVTTRASLPGLGPTTGWAVEIHSPRDIRNEGRAITAWTLGAIATGGLVLALLVAGGLDLTVTRRIARVGREVRTVTKTQDLGARLHEPGSDETGRIAADINRMLAALQAAEARYAGIVAAAGDGIVVVRDGAITFANAAMARIAGLPDAEALTGARFNDRVPAEDHPRLTALLRAAEDGPTQPIRIGFLRHSGGTAAIEVVASGFPEAGHPSVQMIVRDITPRIEDEARQRAIDARMRESQRFESLSVMAGGIAHDFSNLLMTMLGNVVLLRTATDEPEALAAADEIEAAARRAAILTGQLRTFTGHSLDATAPAPIAEVVREIAGILHSSVSHTAQLNIVIEEDLPPVRLDAASIRQVVLNLLTNSAEAIEPRWGAITLSIGATDILAGDLDHVASAAHLPAGSYACIDVSDDGHGIPEAIRERVCDPFFSTRGQGRGLGLAVVAGVARAHGGAVIVESASGAGTRVRVLLPEHNPVAIQTAAPQPARSYARR